jgi:hypothetical protein
MATGYFDVQILVEEKQVEALLGKLDTALNPVAIAAFLGATVDPHIRRRARDRFQAEGDDAVGKWLPLTPATQQIRAQMGYGASHPINVRSGQLQDYIVDAPNQIQVSPIGATLIMPGPAPTGQLADKVRTAQRGSPDGRTPPRPVIGMSEQDLAFVLTALGGYIQKAGGV